MHHYMRQLYEKNAQWRTSLLEPLSQMLGKLGVTPNILSYASVLLMLLFLLFAKTLSPWLLLLLFGSLLLDLMDGPLARTLKITSDKGKFIDMLCDNVCFTLFVLGLLSAELIPGLLSGILIYVMVLSKLLRSIHNSRHYKSDWKFKAVAGFVPNLIVFLADVLFSVYLLVEIDYLSSGLTIFTIILGVDALFFYYKIIGEEPSNKSKR